MTDQATHSMIDAAKDRHEVSGEIEIHDRAEAAIAEGGVWVQAWVWVPDSEL